MVTATQAPLQAEEQLVAELTRLGVRYLSRQSDAGVVKARAFQERLAGEYQSSPGKLLPVKARLSATDRLIDQIVYALYGLTDEEIAIVEGR